VILVDVNLLVYATAEGSPRHEAARAWLNARLNGPYGVGLPWSSLSGFLRVISNPRFQERPMPVDRAWRLVGEWLDLEVTFTPEPAERHRRIVSGLIPFIGNRPNLVPDAHLAALAMEYGLTLCSTDGDFARFPGLRWENPLAGPGS
jgi:uncharacterized protein